MEDDAPPHNIRQIYATATEIRDISRRLKRRLREEAGFPGVTWSQISVLSHLERGGPATITMLAKAEGVRPQSMGATIGTLEEMGLVGGSPHPTDGRQTILSLTDKCRDMLTASRVARDDWLARTIQKIFTEAEQEELVRAVALFKRIAES